MKPIEQISQYIKTEHEKLAQRVVDRVCVQIPEDVPEEERKQAFTMYQELWTSVGESISKNELVIPEALMVWSRNNAAMQTKNGGKISIIVDRYPMSREVMSEILVELSEEFGLTVSEFSQVTKYVNTMLDMSLSETYYAFEKLSALYKRSAEQEIARLSAPLVPIQDGIVVLPLIGEITDDRAYSIMNNVLPKMAAMDVDKAIVDFSGLMTVDEQVVRSLRQIVDALGLMGIQVISTGLRPEMAQQVVHAGMDLSVTTYYANVKQALESLS